MIGLNRAPRTVAATVMKRPSTSTPLRGHALCANTPSHTLAHVSLINFLLR